jgi:glutamine amidotransferase
LELLKMSHITNPKITLVDAGTGNLRSVRKAFEAVGAQVELTRDPDRVRRCDCLVLPGVGAFGDFMLGLRSRSLDEAIIDFVHSGNRMLGICVGMQALFEFSEEMGEHRGLGLLPGRVHRFPDSLGLKIPHTGWNQLQLVPTENSQDHGISEGDFAYFNHSYYCSPDNPSNTISVTDYGVKFSSAVAWDNVYGVQFHPEKSQKVGLQVITAFTHK